MDNIVHNSRRPLNCPICGGVQCIKQISYHDVFMLCVECVYHKIRCSTPQNICCCTPIDRYNYEEQLNKQHRKNNNDG